ncbi:unnamed protein product [Ceratitis capitata]|uniref:(Mediterranean fruit fly) hypothetical protein n=1 Tax=Ceratitis capitata TaxID=7213 RepID=A0A811U9D8_CERCA|nr:unnamed protein product [Ceratitis capitata]
MQMLNVSNAMRQSMQSVTAMTTTAAETTCRMTQPAGAFAFIVGVSHPSINAAAEGKQNAAVKFYNQQPDGRHAVSAQVRRCLLHCIVASHDVYVTFNNRLHGEHDDCCGA